MPPTAAAGRRRSVVASSTKNSDAVRYVGCGPRARSLSLRHRRRRRLHSPVRVRTASATRTKESEERRGFFCLGVDATIRLADGDDCRWTRLLRKHAIQSLDFV